VLLLAQKNVNSDVIYFLMTFNACQLVCVNHQYFRYSTQYHSLLFHNIEVTMSDIDQSNNEANKRFEEEAVDAIETRRIRAIIENKVRRVECGSIVQICKTALLEPESYERMCEEWMYGIVSNEEDICPITGSVAYQINWAYEHLPIGNSCLAFCAAVWEHDFNVVKYPEDEYDEEDIELRRQFIKINGEWCIVEYGGYSCEFCEAHSCDRAQYRDELDDMLECVRLLDIQPHQKRFQMYRKFTFDKYGVCGTDMRHNVDDCVQ